MNDGVSTCINAFKQCHKQLAGGMHYCEQCHKQVAGGLQSPCAALASLLCVVCFDHA